MLNLRYLLPKLRNIEAQVGAYVSYIKKNVYRIINNIHETNNQLLKPLKKYINIFCSQRFYCGYDVTQISLVTGLKIG